MERRISPRFDVQLSGVFGGDRARKHGMVTDISAGGCKFQSTSQVPSGSYIKFKMYLPESNLPLTVDLAVVRWCTDSAMGIEFIRMAPEQQRVLRCFVERLEKLCRQSCEQTSRDMALF